jgi:membrane-associated phospholipid phosphatase
MKHQSLFSRLAAEWKTKLFVGSLVTGAFWLGYFLLQKHPVFPVRVMPSCEIDRLVPFMPEAAAVYVSQFLILSVLAWLTSSKADLTALCKGIGLISGTSFLVFFFWPTCVIRPVSQPGRDVIYDNVVRFDGTENAFPSLHAGFAILIAGYAVHVFRGWRLERILVSMAWLSSAAVLASTLLTKQHVFLDILAGSALGGVGYLYFARTAARSAQ